MRKTILVGAMAVCMLGCSVSINWVLPSAAPSQTSITSAEIPHPDPDIHLSATMEGPVNEADELVLWSGDFETHLYCASGCPDRSDFVHATRNAIVVDDRFPTEYDQWTLTITIAAPGHYPEGALSGRIQYQGRIYSCINTEDLNIRDSSQFAYLASIDPMNNEPPVRALPPFSCREETE
jgi:hypothetical protein